MSVFWKVQKIAKRLAFGCFFGGGSCIFSQNFENFGKIAPPPNNTCPPWAGISGEKMTPAMKSNPKKMEYWGRTWHGCSFKIIKVPRSHYKITFRIEAFALQSTFGSDFFLLFFLVAWSLCGGWRMPLPRRLGGVSGPEAGNGKADIVPFSKTFWHGHPMPSPSEGLPSASFFSFPFLPLPSSESTGPSLCLCFPALPAGRGLVWLPQSAVQCPIQASFLFCHPAMDRKELRFCGSHQH